jgi:hypothetical protein
MDMKQDTFMPICGLSRPIMLVADFLDRQNRPICQLVWNSPAVEAPLSGYRSDLITLLSIVGRM